MLNGLKTFVAIGRSARLLRRIPLRREFGAHSYVQRHEEVRKLKTGWNVLFALKAEGKI